MTGNWAEDLGCAVYADLQSSAVFFSDLPYFAEPRGASEQLRRLDCPVRVSPNMTFEKAAVRDYQSFCRWIIISLCRLLHISVEERKRKREAVGRSERKRKDRNRDRENKAMKRNRKRKVYKEREKVKSSESHYSHNLTSRCSTAWKLYLGFVIAYVK